MTHTEHTPHHPVSTAGPETVALTRVAELCREPLATAPRRRRRRASVSTVAECIREAATAPSAFLFEVELV